MGWCIGYTEVMVIQSVLYLRFHCIARPTQQCDGSFRPLLEGIQWSSSNLDTIESVLIREVSLFQGLKSTQTWYLGRKKVSCLERCPHFRGVLTEGFHCITTIYTRTCRLVH